MPLHLVVHVEHLVLEHSKKKNIYFLKKGGGGGHDDRRPSSLLISLASFSHPARRLAALLGLGSGGGRLEGLRHGAEAAELTLLHQLLALVGKILQRKAVISVTQGEKEEGKRKMENGRKREGKGKRKKARFRDIEGKNERSRVGMRLIFPLFSFFLFFLLLLLFTGTARAW